MTAEIIDQANELAQQRIDWRSPLTASTTQQYQQRTVMNAVTICRRLAGKRIRDARCASDAKAIWNCVRRLGGCDERARNDF